MARTKLSRSPTSAFTLVELLVVLAVVGILASLLIPAVARAHAAARRADCLAKLNQWGVGLKMHTEDHDDEIPRRGQGVRPLTQLSRDEDWFNSLPLEMGFQGFGAYIASAGDHALKPPPLFICPEAKPAPSRYFLSYAMNMYLSPWNQTSPNVLSDLSDPAATVFLADGGVGYSSAFPAVAEYSPRARHGGMANLLFIDGHAASFDGTQIGCFTGVNQRADVVWRFDTNSPPFAP